MTLSNWKSIAAAGICGGIGGTFATLLGVAQILTKQVEGKVLGETQGLVIGLAIFFALGAFVALASGERVPLKALALGIGLPAMISVSASPCSTQGVVCHGLASNLVSLTGVAFAQSVSGRSLILLSPDGNGEFLVWLYDINGNPVGEAFPLVGEGQSSVLPDDAYSIAVQGPDGWSATEALPALAGQTVQLEIGNRSAFSRGLAQSFNAFSGPYDLDLRATGN